MTTERNLIPDIQELLIHKDIKEFKEVSSSMQQLVLKVEDLINRYEVLKEDLREANRHINELYESNN